MASGSSSGLVCPCPSGPIQSGPIHMPSGMSCGPSGPMACTEKWARITGQYDNGAYSWVEIEPLICNRWCDVPNGDVGTIYSMPAFEANGIDVPIGTRVWLKPVYYNNLGSCSAPLSGFSGCSGSGACSEYRFEHCCGLVIPGSFSGGSGSSGPEGSLSGGSSSGPGSSGQGSNSGPSGQSSGPPQPLNICCCPDNELPPELSVTVSGSSVNCGCIYGTYTITRDPDLDGEPTQIGNNVGGWSGNFDSDCTNGSQICISLACKVTQANQQGPPICKFFITFGCRGDVGFGNQCYPHAISDTSQNGITPTSCDPFYMSIPMSPLFSSLGSPCGCAPGLFDSILLTITE